MGHHRSTIRKLTLSLREAARFPQSPPLAATPPAYSGAKKPVAVQSMGAARWDRQSSVSRWTRYGFWDAEGMIFTPTRVL